MEATAPQTRAESSDNRRTIIVASALVTLIASPLGVQAGDRGTILAVYPAEYTAAFKTARNLPVEATADGRFAIARVGDGVVNGDASYALVYVPAGVAVARNTLIKINAGCTDESPQSIATIAGVGPMLARFGPYAS